MYIEAVPNRDSPPAILLRESYREKGRVKKRTLCNLTSWPSHLIEGLRALLKSGSMLPPGSEALTIRRSLPHGRVRAHVFLCMLSYHVEWHLRARLAPMLYDDDDRDAAAAERISIVAKAARSPAAQAKQTLGLTDDGLAVHSFHSLLADLATLTRNEVVTAAAPDIVLTLYARPTAIQQKAFDLLDIDPTRTQ